jgi:hypothetical protein
MNLKLLQQLLQLLMLIANSVAKPPKQSQSYVKLAEPKISN